MTTDFAILTDSGSDLTPEMAAELQVQVMPLMYTLGDGEPMPGNIADIKDFYNQLREGKSAKTSAANYEDLLKTLEDIVSKGKDVLYIAFSSGCNSRQHFAHTFEKFYHMSPSRYRSLHTRPLRSDTQKKRYHMTDGLKLESEPFPQE